MESNDSISAANAVPDTANKIVAYIGTSTDKDYFKVNVGAGVTLKVNMTGPAKDYDLYLYSSAGTLLKSSTSSSCTETVSYQNTGLSSAVSYVIHVKGYNGATSTTPYNLALTKSGSSTTVSVSISPTSASLSVNTTKQFSATVSGSSNTSVTWTCTGGSVNASGLYTAPNAVGTYTVKATSNAAHPVGPRLFPRARLGTM